MKYTVVTSFSAEGYEQYGGRFLETFQDCWPTDIRLEIYSEDWSLPAWAGSGNLGHHNLHSLFDYDDFVQKCPKSSDNYRWDARRFAHKAFAITDPGARGSTDWLIWLDADVETIAPIDEAFLAKACPEGFLASYLGRKDWNTSECGWVAYNMNAGADLFLRRFRNIYTSGEIYSHLEWHDSYLFDRVREEFETQGHKFKNLSEGIEGLHVWPETVLGERMVHAKGPLRKKGKRIEGLPESYWSRQERA